MPLSVRPGVLYLQVLNVLGIIFTSEKLFFYFCQSHKLNLKHEN